MGDKTQKMSTHDLTKLENYKVVNTAYSKPFTHFYRKYYPHDNRRWITVDKESGTNNRISLMKLISKWSKKVPNPAGNVDSGIRRMLVDPDQVVFNATSGDEPTLTYHETGCWIAAESHYTPEEYVSPTDSPGAVGMYKVKSHIEFDCVVRIYVVGKNPSISDFD